MRYLGGKSRIAKRLVAQMPDDVGCVYEPFCGGGAVTVALAQKYGAVQASDVHEDLIHMWRSLQEGWEPPTEVSEDDYQHWRYTEPTTQEEAALKAFIGYGCSFGGKWFGGFARSVGRDHSQESRRNVLKQAQHLSNVTFVSGYYDTLVKAKPGDLVYCDPPYEGTTKYKDDFDHERFWGWANRLADSGVLVYVSEYNAPDGWTEVWRKEQKLQVKRNDGSSRETRVERLFTKEVTQ